MPADKPNRKAAARKKRLAEPIEALTALQFGPKQRNETAAYTLLALLDLQPDAAWADAQAPLRGITPIIDFIATAYGIHHLAPQGMAGIVLANGSMSSNQSGDCNAWSEMKTPDAAPQMMTRQRGFHRALAPAHCIAECPRTIRAKSNELPFDMAGVPHRASV